MNKEKIETLKDIREQLREQRARVYIIAGQEPWATFYDDVYSTINDAVVRISEELDNA